MGKSSLARVVSGHTRFNVPPDVIFMFGHCTEGKERFIFLSVCYSSLLARRADSGEYGITCQSKPTETWWASHCRSSGDKLAVHWNSSDIGTWLAAQCWLISLSTRSTGSHSHAPSLLWLNSKQKTAALIFHVLYQLMSCTLLFSILKLHLVVNSNYLFLFY